MGDRIGVQLYGIIVTNISSGQNNPVLKDTLEDRIHMTQDESIGHKSHTFKVFSYDILQGRSHRIYSYYYMEYLCFQLVYEKTNSYRLIQAYKDY